MLSPELINIHSRVSGSVPMGPPCFNINLLKNSFRNTIRVSNDLDPDQDQHCRSGQTFCRS